MKASALTNLTNAERIAQLDQYIAENRILRMKWVSKSGRKRACLLAALVPEVASNGKFHGIDRCPASVLPMWLALITPDLDDSVTKAYWPTFLRDYASTIRRIYVLIEQKRWTQHDWNKQNYLARAAVLRLALSFAGDHRDMISEVIDHCERVGRRNKITESLEAERKLLMKTLNRNSARHTYSALALQAAREAISKTVAIDNLADVCLTISRVHLNGRTSEQNWDLIAKIILKNLNHRCDELEQQS